MPGIEPGPPGWEPGILTTGQHGTIEDSVTVNLIFAGKLESIISKLYILYTSATTAKHLSAT